MLIWILTTGEQFPVIDGASVRPWRSVLLSNALIEKGHTVLRWTADFDHVSKQHRFGKYHIQKISPSYSIHFLDSPGYKKNISLARFVDHYILAKRFRFIANTSPLPDLIFCSIPTVELAKAATDFGKNRGIPVVLDGRDMWPDLFLDFLPQKLRFLGKGLLFNMFKEIKKACKNAFALSGISQPYLAWQANYAGRELTLNDQWFPHGYTSKSPSQEEQEKGFSFWQESGLDPKNDFIICLFTAMGNVVDINTIIEAARILNEKGISIKFVLCGDGEKLASFKNAAKTHNNIIFPGWISFAQIWTLMRLSKLGILPYLNIDNYKFNIPNKPIEYLSAGLPVLSSIEGVLDALLLKHKCGLTFKGPESLALSISKLKADPSLLKEMSNNATNLFYKDFEAETVYANMANYLVECQKKYAH